MSSNASGLAQQLQTIAVARQAHAHQRSRTSLYICRNAARTRYLLRGAASFSMKANTSSIARGMMPRPAPARSPSMVKVLPVPAREGCCSDPQARASRTEAGRPVSSKGRCHSQRSRCALVRSAPVCPYAMTVALKPCRRARRQCACSVPSAALSEQGACRRRPRGSTAPRRAPRGHTPLPAGCPVRTRGRR